MPTAFKVLEKEDQNGEYLTKYDITNLKYLFLAGERLDPDTYFGASNLLNRSVIDIDGKQRLVDLLQLNVLE